ncbi:MAG: arginine deiminase family protein [Bacillota bacterium]|nr:arginine deiminase family protein [Bacillota bacterium]
MDNLAKTSELHSPQKYGTEEFGRLKTAILHQPLNSLKIINQGNHNQWLFDQVPDVDRFLEEHQRYTDLLRSLVVDVIELSDYVFRNKWLMNQLPNLVYMHDSSVITKHGAILSKMTFKARENEAIIVKKALSNLGIPIFSQFKEQDQFEGCLILSPKTLFIANTERHSKQTIMRFIPKALTIFEEVIYVEIPQHRRFMHPDTIFNRVSNHLAIVYLPAFLRSLLITRTNKTVIDDFTSFMKSRDIELVNINDSEQQSWGCTFVPLEQNVMIHYDIAFNNRTKNTLRNKGVDLIEFHPEALLAGGGSLRCLTLRVLRE